MAATSHVCMLAALYFDSPPLYSTSTSTSTSTLSKPPPPSGLKSKSMKAGGRKVWAGGYRLFNFDLLIMISYMYVLPSPST